MDKNLLKNLWALAGLLMAINIVLGLIILFAVEFFKIGSSGVSAIAGMVGAMIVGQIYAMSFKEIMPKKLRIHVTITYTLAQMVLGSLYIFVLDISNYLLFFAILIGISLFYSLIIYFMLGSGGKIYLKGLQKREAPKGWH